MSKNRKNLKAVSICLMTVGVVVPVMQIVLALSSGQQLNVATIAEMVFLGVVGLATGYLGSMAANVPSKTPTFLKAAYLTVVVGVAMSAYRLYVVVDVYSLLGLVFAVLAVLGIFYGRKVLEKAQK